jgi:hypothetical protein
MAEVHRVMEHINGKCERAQVVMGAAIDESISRAVGDHADRSAPRR